jgi:hypothetical protein
MYWISVNTSGWVDGGHTEIRIGFTDEAKAEAERWSSSEEKLIERCFWRFVSEHWDEIKGDSVTFEVDLAEIQGLISRLPAFEADKLN